MRIEIDTTTKNINRAKELIKFAFKEKYHSELCLLHTNNLFFYETPTQAFVMATLKPIDDKHEYYQHSINKGFESIEKDINKHLYITHNMDLHYDYVNFGEVYDLHIDAFNIEDKEQTLINIKEIKEILLTIFPNPTLNLIHKIYRETDNGLNSYYSFHIENSDRAKMKQINIPIFDIENYYNDIAFKGALTKNINDIYKIDIAEKDITEENMPHILLQIKAITY